MTVIYSQN